MPQHILFQHWRFLYNLHDQIEVLLEWSLFIEDIAKVICIEYFIHEEIIVHYKGICLCQLIKWFYGIFEVELMVSTHHSRVEGSMNINQDVHADIVYIA